MLTKAKITVTGHSLGGSLALTVGAKKYLKTVTFNAPVPKDKLSKKDKQYILDNPTKITSYLNVDDLIGNYNNSYTLFGGLCLIFTLYSIKLRLSRGIFSIIIRMGQGWVISILKRHYAHSHKAN